MRLPEVCRAAPAAAVAIAALLTGCGAPAQAPSPTPSPIGPVPSDTDGGAPAGSEDAVEGAIVLIGTLGGDGQLEGGCVWFDAGGKRYELQLPEGYTVTFGPLQMIGRDGEVVATDGDRLHLLGKVATDVMTICQVGPLFKVHEVHPL